MAIVLAVDADRAVRRLTAGQFHLEADDDGIHLVNVESRECVLIAQSAADRTMPAGGLREIEEKLSARERQVFELLGAGLNMIEISERLGVSIKSTETYRSRIRQKLGIQKRTRLVALAVEWVLSRRLGDDGFAEPCPAG
jgi:DNA-binding NarL/FixJ family response regulator